MKEIEEAEISFYIQIIKSPLLDRQVRGMRELCDLLDKLTPDAATLKLVEENGVVKHILEKDNFNCEVIKRAHSLLVNFLAYKGCAKAIVGAVFALIPDVTDHEQGCLFELAVVLAGKKASINDHIW